MMKKYNFYVLFYRFYIVFICISWYKLVNIHFITILFIVSTIFSIDTANGPYIDSMIWRIYRFTVHNLSIFIFVNIIAGVCIGFLLGVSSLNFYISPTNKKPKTIKVYRTKEEQLLVDNELPFALPD